MKIAILGSNFIRISPNYNQLPSGFVGAPEFITSQITEGLVRKGHEVTLFASGDSKTSAKLVSVTDTALVNMKDFDFNDLDTRRDWEYLLISKAYQVAKQGEFDIIHSQFDKRSAYFSPLLDTPTVSTLHSPLSGNLRKILKHFKNTQFWVSISNAQRKKFPDLNYINTIYHGLDLEKIKFCPKPEDYLAFVGRIRTEKGTHLAIKVAQKVDSKLKIAGEPSPKEQKYFNQKIKPYFNSDIQYLGLVLHKNIFDFLGNARALLFPIQWEEPFGLVMIEAMATGTPVVAFGRGSVPEIVKDGETGFVIKPGDVDAMAEAVRKIQKMPNSEYSKMRQNCRQHVKDNFSIEKMISGYEKVYQKILNKRG